MVDKSVAIQLRKRLRETIQNNREKIVETIVLCGRQNIALRGHRDSGTNMEGVQSGGALLNFRISAGDDLFIDHLQRAPRNATCTSPDVQNQIISILGDQI